MASRSPLSAIYSITYGFGFTVWEFSVVTTDVVGELSSSVVRVGLRRVVVGLCEANG